MQRKLNYSVRITTLHDAVADSQGDSWLDCIILHHYELHKFWIALWHSVNTISFWNHIFNRWRLRFHIRKINIPATIDFLASSKRIVLLGLQNRRHRLYSSKLFRWLTWKGSRKSFLLKTVQNDIKTENNRICLYVWSMFGWKVPINFGVWLEI